MLFRTKTKDVSQAADWLVAGGKMSELIRAMDWSATPLGPRDVWPATLHTTVNLVLGSSFPMAILWGSDLTLIYNDAYCVIAADKHPQALGRSTREVWSNVWEFNRPIFEKVMTQGETVHLEDYLFRIFRHGYMEDAYFTLSYSPIFTETGKIGGTLVTLLETTQRLSLEREMEQRLQENSKILKTQVDELKQNEELLQGIIDNIPILLCIWESHLKRFQLNKHMRDVLGWTEADVAEGDFMAKVYPDPAYRQQVVQYMQSLEGGWRDLQTTAKDGTPIDCSWANIALSDGRMIGIGIDIRQRKAAEATLRESEERLRETIESIPSLIWTARPDGWVDYLNHRWLGYTGQPAEAAIGSRWMNFLHPDDLAKAKREWEQAVAEGHDYEVEQRLRGADGSYCWFLVRATPLRDTHGYITKWYGTNFDITDRKQAEEQLKAASKAKDHFLAVLSHELRNPLTPVLAAASMLQEDPRFDRDTLELLEIIRRNAELEARLIDDLLDVTRIERGKIDLDRRPIELGTVIRRAVEVCTPDIEARSLRFGVEMKDEPYWVDADAARLQQVFWNLLKNAIKFTPVGGHVLIRCHRQEGYVTAEVSDSGIGIEPEMIPKLFNAFEQAERSITRQFGGLGLGLTISKSLVVMHGGSIQVHSAGKNKGATFTIRLPLLPIEAAVPTPPPLSQAPPSTVLARPLRILLVEDQMDTTRIMRRLLVGSGHEIQIASDIASALALTESRTFDLLLSDLGLPDGSGLDLMRQLRAKGLKLPGIALSGYGQEQDIVQSQEAGFAEHLVKPVNIDRLRMAIQRVME